MGLIRPSLSDHFFDFVLRSAGLIFRANLLLAFMSYKHLPLNVWLLCLAYIFAFTGTNITIFLGGIIGSQLTDIPGLGTLPVTLLIVGIGVGSMPAARIMQRFSRRYGFMGAACYASLSALMGAWAIYNQSFAWYCLACFSLGLSTAFVQQYRFAASESVSPAAAPQAIAAILLSGVVAAFLGPTLANLAKHWLPVPFVGSYLILALLVLMPALILSRLQTIQAAAPTITQAPRSMASILQQPRLVLAISAACVGYGVMSFIMTATPISMHVIDGHSVGHTGVVIQWHIVGMFLPSLVTGKLIKRFGHYPVLGAGLVANVLCILISQLDHSVMAYWLALVSLGIGWNFLFVTGTALLIQCYRDSERYRVQGLNDTLVFGFQAVASLSAGWVISISNWETTNLAMLPLLGILLMSMVYAKYAESSAVKTS